MREAAPVERQLANLVAFDNVSHRASGSLDLESVGLNRHLFRGAADGQRGIHSGRAGDEQLHAFADVLLEVRRLDRQVVAAGGQVCKRIFTAITGLRGTDCAGGRIRDSDFRTGNDCARRVTHNARDCSGNFLCS